MQKKNLPKGRLGTVRASGSEYDSASCSSQSEAKEATESKSYTQQHDVYSCNQMGIAIRELPVACKPVFVTGGGTIEFGRLCGARLLWEDIKARVSALLLDTVLFRSGHCGGLPACWSGE